MILWMMKDGQRNEVQAVREAQRKVDEAGSVGKYVDLITQNTPWNEAEEGRRWMRERWETMKQVLEIELRKKFYGYP